MLFFLTLQVRACEASAWRTMVKLVPESDVARTVNPPAGELGLALTPVLGMLGSIARRRLRLHGCGRVKEPPCSTPQIRIAVIKTPACCFASLDRVGRIGPTFAREAGSLPELTSR